MLLHASAACHPTFSSTSTFVSSLALYFGIVWALAISVLGLDLPAIPGSYVEHNVLMHRVYRDSHFLCICVEMAWIDDVVHLASSTQPIEKGLRCGEATFCCKTVV